MKLTVLTTLFLAAAPAFAAEVYVSAQHGDDAHAGTKEKPVASLERARDLARAVTADEDVSVILDDSVWRLQKTFELDARDSGKNGHRMIYRAAPGAHPSIIGSRAISGWTASTSLPGVWQAPSGEGLFRQCYVDGDWEQLARSPYFKLTGADAKLGTFSFDVHSWPKDFAAAAPKDLELAVCVHWRHLVVHCDSHRIEQDQKVVLKPTADEATRSFNPGPPSGGDTCHLQNALALLDAPGEWYRSPGDGQLFYKPKAGQDMQRAQVEAPVLETLIAITGTPERPVSNLEFHGITLAGTGWTRPSSHGLYATQFAQPYMKGVTVPGALMATHTSDFAFRDGTIRLAGANALVLDHAKSAAISNCRFADIGCNGIVGSGEILNAAIWNNEITRCGRDVSNGGGILLLNPTRGARIEHNHIFDLPYSGMQIGNQPGGYKDTGTRDNKIRFNHVHHCMQLHDDGGGIYTLGGQQRGTEIAFNFIHDIKRSRWADSWPVNGVYLDNYTQFVHVHDNVIRDCTTAAKEQNHSKDNRIENNPAASAEIERKAGIQPEL